MVVGGRGFWGKRRWREEEVQGKKAVGGRGGGVKRWIEEEAVGEGLSGKRQLMDEAVMGRECLIEGGL